MAGKKRAAAVGEAEGMGMEDIKKSLDFMAGELSTIKKQQGHLVGLLKEVQELKRMCEEKDRKINLLETRLQEMEQNAWINDVVVSGVEVRPRSFERAVGGDGGQQEDEDTASVEDQVGTALNCKGIYLDANSIDICYSFKKRHPSDKSTVILKLKDRKSKIAIVQQGKKLKGSHIYLNDHLIKANNDVARKARELRKADKIAHTWTKDCKIFIKLKEPQNKVIMIKRLEELEAYI